MKKISVLLLLLLLFIPLCVFARSGCCTDLLQKNISNNACSCPNENYSLKDSNKNYSDNTEEEVGGFFCLIIISSIPFALIDKVKINKFLFKF